MKCTNNTIGSEYLLSFRHAIAHLINFSKIVPIMLALCLMLLVTYYALNYAGIIGQCLPLAGHGHAFGLKIFNKQEFEKCTIVWGFCKSGHI